MSTEADTQEHTPVQKSKKHKHSSDRKESKKRKREENASSSTQPNGEKADHPAASQDYPSASPVKESKKKKAKKAKLEENNGSQLPDVVHEQDASTTNGITGKSDALAGAPESPATSPATEQPKKKKKKKHKEKEKLPEADEAESSTFASSKDLNKQRNPAPIDPESSTSQAPKATAKPATETIPDTDPENSPFFTQITFFYLPLSPIAQDKPLEGLCAEHFSPLLLTFAEPFNGLVLSYSNPRFQEPPPASIIRQLHKAQRKAARSHGDASKTQFAILSKDSSTNSTLAPSEEISSTSQPLARAVDEYGVTFVWLAADFLILQPQLGSWIEGYVSVQSPSQLGLVCWNLLNASIERKHLPKNWKWVGDDNVQNANNSQSKKASKKSKAKAYEGHYVDENGKEIDGMLQFRVLQIDSLHASGKDRNFMSIEGSLLTEEAEKGNKK